MASLRNILQHMRGAIIGIDGVDYQLDADGVVHGVPDADAKEMVLRSGTPWREHTVRSPVIATPVAIPEAQPVPEAPKPIPTQDELPKAAEPCLPNPPKEVEPGDDGKAWAIPAKGKDWPDPEESMPIDYLKKMATAYKVKVPTKASKKALIKAIEKVMFKK